MFTLRRFCIGAALGLSLLACSPAHAQTNLLQDGGFEPGPGLSKWQIDPAPFASGAASLLTGTGTTAHSGKGYAALGPNILATTSPSASVAQALTVKTGDRYRFSGFAKTTGPGSFSAPTFTVGLSTTAFGNNVERAPVYGSATSRGYRPFRATVVATNATVLAHFRRRKTHRKSRPVNLDDVSLTDLGAAPEIDPRAGTPALALALGGLALMSERRRKRTAPGDEPTTTG